jgi:hypothetical protein
MKASHTLNTLGLALNDLRLVGKAGHLISALLGQRVGLPEMSGERLDAGAVPGAADPGAKALTLIASLLAGGDYIDPVNVLRPGNSAVALGHPDAAASAARTFLRALTWNHALIATAGPLNAGERCTRGSNAFAWEGDVVVARK